MEWLGITRLGLQKLKIITRNNSCMLLCRCLLFMHTNAICVTFVIEVYLSFSYSTLQLITSISIYCSCKDFMAWLPLIVFKSLNSTLTIFTFDLSKELDVARIDYLVDFFAPD